jgi:hypothetical protein
MIGYMQEVGTFGGQPEYCRIDYGNLACVAYNLSLMTTAQRRQLVDQWKQQGQQPSWLHLDCQVVGQDSAYGQGYRSISAYPPIPSAPGAPSASSATAGLSTGQKAGIAIGVGAVLAIVGVAVLA